MHTFRALVVDDQAEIRELALDTGSAESGTEVIVASSLLEARKIIDTSFVHVAFVDMQLGEGARVNVDGMTVLHHLREVRPSCKRFLLTQYPTVYRRQLFQLLDPEAPVIDGALDKDDFEHLFVDYVAQEATDWLNRPVEIRGLDEVINRLVDKRAALRIEAHTTTEELDYVLSRLFGQGSRTEGQDGEDEIGEVTLSILTGGKSRSVVCIARLRTRNLGEGIPCVIKIGTRAETEQEIRRYDRYVRYRMQLHRRVEVLNSQLGDTLGAVCYSLAGEDADRITDLQTLLDAADSRAIVCMSQLFKDGALWAEPSAASPDLAGFFSKAYGLDPLKSLSAIREFAGSSAVRNLGCSLTGDRLHLGESSVRLPTDTDLGAGRLRRRYASSIVHGDLNASNVIVAESGTSRLIDFRHTTRGPATIDFAALQTSVRLTPDACQHAADDGRGVQVLERRLWAHDFAVDHAWWPEQSGEPIPFWAQASAALRVSAADGVPEVDSEEHAMTCLLYALRVFRVVAIPPAARLRLLIWIAELIAILESRRAI
jgi:CheY-like chemotaxis protein